MLGLVNNCDTGEELFVSFDCSLLRVFAHRNLAPALAEQCSIITVFTQTTYCIRELPAVCWLDTDSGAGGLYEFAEVAPTLRTYDGRPRTGHDLIDLGWQRRFGRSLRVKRKMNIDRGTQLRQIGLGLKRQHAHVTQSRALHLLFERGSLHTITNDQKQNARI